MTAVYRTIPNPTYTNLNFISIWQPATQHILTRLYYVHTYVPIYKFKVFSLHNIINYSTCTNSQENPNTPASGMPVPGKYFLKQENNELNEFSECLFYKMFPFPENISKL